MPFDCLTLCLPDAHYSAGSCPCPCHSQVNNAQHSILGPGADLQSLGLTVHRPMKEADFVEHMLKTCKAGVPFANS
eukprot:1155694-Pelagomonas_calceolata.AAC.1